MVSNVADNRLDTTSGLSFGAGMQKNPLVVPQLSGAMREVEASLRGFAASSEFAGSMNTAFGSSWNAAAVSKLQSGWLIGNFGDLILLVLVMTKFLFLWVRVMVHSKL